MDEPIVVEYQIKAPVDKVWNALTDKEEMKIWYFDIPDFKLGLFEIFNFYEPGDEKKYHHQAQILEIVTEKKLKHTWNYPKLSKGKTMIIWELESNGNEETLVRLTHDEIDNLKELGENFSEEAFTEGWNEIIGESLKTFLEE